MKTNKKCLPILLAALMVMSLLPCFASAAGSWTEAVLVPEAKSAGVNFVPATGHEQELAVFEWHYDYPSDFDTTTAYGLYSPNANRYDAITVGGVTAFDTSKAAVTAAATKMNTLGGQRIHGLEIVNLADKTRRIWINGVEYTTGTTKSSLNVKDDVKFVSTAGTIAYVNPADYALADFDASGYDAQLTSSNANVIVGGTKLSGNGYALNHTLTVKGDMTAGALKGALSASTGASIAVLNAAGEVVQDAAAVEQGFAVKVTSKNGAVIVKYTITVEDGSWTETILTPVEKVGGFTPNSGHATDAAVFEWYFDFPEDSTTNNYGLYDGDATVYDVLTSGEKGLTAFGSTASNIQDAWPRLNTVGGQRIHGLEIWDLGTQKRRVWINGAEVPDCANSVMKPGGWVSFRNVQKGTVAYVNPAEYAVADFDASGYAAQLTSSDEEVIVGGAKLGSAFALNHTLTLKKKMTVEALKDVLSVSEGASIVVLDAAGNEVLDETVAVTKGFAVQVTSANKQVIVKYNVPTEPGSWTEAVLAPVEKTGSFTPNAGHTNDAAVFEWYFDFPEEIDPTLPLVSPYTGVKYYGLWDGDATVYDVVTCNIGLTGFGSGKSNIKESWRSIKTLGGQRIHGIEIWDLTNQNRRVWINGAEVPDCENSVMKPGGWVSFQNVQKGTVAYVDPTQYALADFDASGYAAQLTSKDLNKVVVGGAKLGSSVALNHTLSVKDEDMTVAELKALLDPSGATIAVLNAGGTAAQETDVVGNGFAVQVTSENGAVIVKYNITVVVPVYATTEEGLEVSVMTNDSTANLYLAVYSADGKTLEKVVLGAADEAEPNKLVANLTAAEITGKKVKAFHWINNLEPLAMKVYGAE